MKWKNLKENSCPKCDQPLKELRHFILCSNKETGVCDFMISRTRFNDLIEDMYKVGKRPSIVDEQEQNLKGLNDL